MRGSGLRVLRKPGDSVYMILVLMKLIITQRTPDKQNDYKYSSKPQGKPQDVDGCGDWVFGNVT